MTGDESLRLRTAREKYAEAHRAERRARIAAADELRRRARHRRAGIRLTVVSAVVVCAVLLALAAWGLAARAGDVDELDRDSAARGAAITAITGMLTADPADPDGYLQRILDDTVGDQRERLEQVGPQLRAAIAALPRPSTGQVLSAGVAEAADERVTVVLVAQASDPQLLGAQATQNRLALRVTMIRSGDRWLVQATEPIAQGPVS